MFHNKSLKNKEWSLTILAPVQCAVCWKKLKIASVIYSPSLWFHSSLLLSYLSLFFLVLIFSPLSLSSFICFNYTLSLIFPTPFSFAYSLFSLHSFYCSLTFTLILPFLSLYLPVHTYSLTFPFLLPHLHSPQDTPFLPAQLLPRVDVPSRTLLLPPLTPILSSLLSLDSTPTPAAPPFSPSPPSTPYTSLRFSPVPSPPRQTQVPGRDSRGTFLTSPSKPPQSPFRCLSELPLALSSPPSPSRCPSGSSSGLRLVSLLVILSSRPLCSPPRLTLCSLRLLVCRFLHGFCLIISPSSCIFPFSYLFVDRLISLCFWLSASFSFFLLSFPHPPLSVTLENVINLRYKFVLMI